MKGMVGMTGGVFGVKLGEMSGVVGCGEEFAG